MSNEKLIKVMKNFDEEYLFALLGDLKDNKRKNYRYYFSCIWVKLI